MPLSVLKCNYVKCKPKVITCRCFRGFDSGIGPAHGALNGGVNNPTRHAFGNTYFRILNIYAPLKQIYIISLHGNRGSHVATSPPPPPPPIPTKIQRINFHKS